MEVGHFGDVPVTGIDLRLVICGKCEVLFCVVPLGKSQVDEETGMRLGAVHDAAGYVCA